MKKILLIALFLATQLFAAPYPTMKTGIGGIPVWGAGGTYQLNEHVTHLDVLYRAIAPFTAGGAFVPANWVEQSDNLNREAAASVTDRTLLVWDGTTGDDVLGTGVTLSIIDVMSGLTQLNVDNLRLDGNSISSQNVNGDITLDPNGTGKVVVNSDLDVLGTITQISLASLAVTNATIIVNDTGNQATADANDAGIIVEMSDATDAQIGYDSTCATRFQSGEVGSLDCSVNETVAQSLTNKELGNTAVIDTDLVLDMITTSKASRPCPQMTLAQRDLLTAVNGSCIYNTTTNKLNIYNGTTWVAAGGGIDLWATTTVFNLEDVVHESNKIYRAIIAHTSGVFAADLAANRWVELSDDLSRLGASTDEGIVRFDGLTGDIVQDSSVTIDDSGNITTSGTITTGLTQNSVVFAGALGVLAEDNTNFTFNDGTDTLNVTGILTVDNLSLNGNVISSTDTNGNVVVTPDGLGVLATDNLSLDGNTLASTDVNGNLILDANGTGQLSFLDFLLMPHLADPASSPAAASSNLFFKADEVLHDMDENGVVNPVDNRNSNDILANRSFEKSYGATTAGWTGLVGAATTATISGVASCAPGQGDQCVQIAPIAQTFTYTQNINCDTSDGKQIGFSGWVKAGYQTEICALKAGVVDESSCLTTPADDKWTKRTTTMFATSGDTCGVQVRSTAAVSGLATFDGFKFELDPIKSATKAVVEHYRTSDPQGYGSTNTLIPYFKATPDYTSISSSGVIANDSTNGWSFTASRKVNLSISGDIGSTVGGYIGITKNSTALTTSILSETDEKVIALGYESIGGAPISMSGSDILLEAGDVIRFHAHTAITLGGGSQYTSVSFSASYQEEVMATNTNSGLTPWTDDGAITIGAVTTPPTKGTVTTDSMKWRRVGDSMEIQFVFEKSAGGANGSGTYLWQIPSGYTIDTTKIAMSVAAQNDVNIGSGFVSTSISGQATVSRTAVFATYDTTHFQMISDSGTDDNLEFVGSANLGMGTNAQIRYSGKVTLPIVEFAAAATFPVYIPFGKPCLIRDVQTGGTNGANVTANTIHTLTLNTVGAHCGFAKLSANQVNLVPGEYKVCGKYAVNEVSRHRGYFYGAGASGYGNGGVNSAINFAGGDMNQSSFCRVFEISVAEAFELRVWAQDTKTNGFGYSMDFASGGGSSGLPAGDNEIYAELEITMIKGAD